LEKDSTFGYRDCKQNDYRFYREYDHEYQILETKSIISSYFFSTTLNSEILPLTVANLKRTFPGNLKFHDKLNTEFNGATDIAVYDNEHKMYKVNYLLSQTTAN